MLRLEQCRTHLELLLEAILFLLLVHFLQLLNALTELVDRNLCLSAHGALEDGIMQEDVLSLRLHHVVPLFTELVHKVEWVYAGVCFCPLELGINGQERSRSTYTSTSGCGGVGRVGEQEGRRIER